MKKTAFITGITGQDGSYLAELLLTKGYEVHGLVRQSTQFSQDKWGHIKHIMDKIFIHHGDVTDTMLINSIISNIKPTEVYNLAAQSHVGQSFSQPLNTSLVTGISVLNLLDSIKNISPSTKLYQAGSSECFGKVKETPQSETTQFHPRSPYGCAKVFAHYATQNYREAYNLFAVNGILFNHESERRGENFVTRKITRAIGRIVAGTQTELVLGNTDARRDWGYAPDYVDAMYRMMQATTPNDYVIGTGLMHSVQDFVNVAFETANLSPEQFVKTDKRFIRPAEVDTLCANPEKAKNDLDWQPTVTFKLLVQRMVEHDIRLAHDEKKQGFCTSTK